MEKLESRVTAIQCNTREQAFMRISDLKQIPALRDDPDALIWIDLYNPTDKELARAAEIFDLHPLAIEDASREHQRPKIDEYEDFFLVVFHTIRITPADKDLEVNEVDIFVGENYLISVHSDPLPELKEVETRWTRNIRTAHVGVGILLYTLLDTFVDQYLPTIEILVDESEKIEERIFSRERTNTAVTLELLELKKRFLEMRRIITPEQDVLRVLNNRDTPIFSEHVNIYFRDITDHITRMSEILDLYREQINNIMEANLAIASNDLNKVMRTLTGASIILMFDALIAGIYGMNFDNMPELHWEYGYYAALLVMLTGSLLIAMFFKYLRWL